MTTVIQKNNLNQESHALYNRNSNDLYNLNSNTSNLSRIKKFISYSKEDPINKNRLSHFTSQHLLRFDSVPSSSSSHIESKYLSNYRGGTNDYKSNHESNNYAYKVNEKFLDEFENKNDTSFSSDLRSSDENDEDVNENDHYDEEFKSVLKRITIKNGKILMKKRDASTNSNEFTHVTSRSNVNSNNFQEDDVTTNNNNNNLNPTSITVTTLKYLFKLLKFYKLEHYMSDLIENGYQTPISLHKLKQNELDTFSVSPYDKKKFLKLQLFIKQLMTTINKSKSNGNAKNSSSGRSTYRSTSSASLTGQKFSMEEKRFLDSDDLKNFNSELSTGGGGGGAGTDNSMPKTKSWNDYNFIKDINNNNNNNVGADIDDVDDDDPSSYVSFKPKSLSASNLPNEIVKSSNEAFEENQIQKSIEPALFTNTRTNVQQKEPSWSESKNAGSTTSASFDPNRNTNTSNKIGKRIVQSNMSKNIPSTSTTTSKSFSKKEITSQQSNQNRAKSSEPTLYSSRQRASNLNPTPAVSLTSKSTTEKNSVCHPSLSKVIKNSNTNFFGPKLSSNNNNNNVEQETANVKIVETQTYNYGVPQKQQQVNAQTHKRHHVNNNRRAKSHSNHDNHHQQNNTNKVTADIFVYARKRPLLDSESQFNDAIFIENNADETRNICVNEMKSLVDGTPLLRKNEFEFDRTFDSSFSNEDIFKTSIMPFVDVPMENRIDFTCICFGQTGSGKTHTLFGNKLQDGLCVLTAQTLFKNNERIFCGFYEIYNGQLYDLLNQNSRLVLREDSNGQVNVVGLVEAEIKNLSQLRSTFETAQNNRHIGSTSFNRASSRSHAIIQFKIQNVPLTSNQTGQQIIVKNNQGGVKSKVNSGLNNGVNKTSTTHRVLFIDLAGSERGIDAQNNINDNRKEGAEINQSLLALKECIRCIDQYCTHAPFRQSKLTRVLRDCFIGFGRTILIATVSPTEDCVSCSLNTLQYANRVRQMTLRGRKNNEKSARKVVQTSSSTNVLYSNQKVINKSSQNPIITQSHQQQQSQSSVRNNKNLEENSNKHAVAYSVPIANSSPNPSLNQKILTKTTQATSNESKPLINKNLSNRYTSQSKTKTPLFNGNTANTNANQNILPPKPVLKYQPITSTNVVVSNGAVNQNPSLFHPSKINMSSTPIKTLINGEKEMTNGEEMIFENDTPIKGHKLRYIANNGSKAIAHLAEKYFNKADEKPKSLSYKFENKNNQVIYNRDKSKEYQTTKQAEINELNDRLYHKEAPKIKDDILNRYAEIKYDKYTNFDTRYKKEEKEFERDDFFDIKNRNKFSSDLIYSTNNKSKEYYTCAPTTSSTLQKSNLFNKPFATVNSNNFLQNTSASRNTTTIPSQLGKLTTEIDRIKDRQSFRGSYLANNNNNYSTNKLTSNYVQRYKSIYSSDSPNVSPSRSPPIQQNYYQSRLNDNYKLGENNLSTNYDFSKLRNQYSITNQIGPNKDETNSNKINNNNNNNTTNNNVSLMEENLIQLRKKQKEFLELKKASNLYMANNSSNDTNDQIDEDCLNEDNANSDAEIEKLIENSNILLEQLQNENNASIDMIKKDANSQRKIKNYIQLLEGKLVKLRSEMKDQTLVPDGNSMSMFKPTSFRERSVSSDSCDSLKEIENRHNETNRMYSKVIYNEFMQRKSQLEKDQQKYAEANRNPMLFGDDDYDKQFIEMQIQRQEPLSKKNEFNLSPSFPINNIKELDQISGDENNCENNDNLKKSFHKGNMTEVFFKKNKELSESAKKLDLSSLNEPLVCEFSPITQTKNDEKENGNSENKTNLYEKFSTANQESTENTNSQLTPRSQFNKHQLVNPIPIRLSSSSSFDSSISKYNQVNGALKANTNGHPNKNDDHSSSYENQNSSRSLVSSNDGSNVNLKNSNSKIWKSAVNNQSGNKNTWSDILKENDAINQHQNENDLIQTLKTNDESTLNQSDYHNETNEKKGFQSKDQLVVAHEHQLSDITETCKIEMNLLSCLKDSQMGFDDYLNKVEEMLSKKAHSIRDLQDQINQLKTLKSTNENGITVNLLSHENT